MKSRWIATIVAVMCVFGSAGCGKNVDIKTPPGFVELRNQEIWSYDYRATTPDGLVLAARKIEAKDRTDLAFWERALTLHGREELGYALLSTHDVATGSGLKGKQLRFGHDVQGKPYQYWVTVFPSKETIYVLEAGGPADQMTTAESQIQWHINTLKE